MTNVRKIANRLMTAVPVLVLAAGLAACGAAGAPAGGTVSSAVSSSSAASSSSAMSSGSAVSSSSASASSAPASSAPASSPAPASTSAPSTTALFGSTSTRAPGTRLTLTGTVEAGVEASCVVLTDEKTGRRFNLSGGDKAVVKVGARITVTGRIRTDLMSYCQQGAIFEVATAATA